MLESLTFTGRELLLAVLLASLVYLLEVWLLPRLGKVKAARSNRVRIAALEAEIEAMKQRLQVLEEQPPSGSRLDSRAVTYADAQRMAREGVAAIDLASTLGISRSEAELIIALQRAESHAP